MKKLILSLAAVALFSISIPAAETKVDFVKQIHPILKENCIKCHGAEKQKGKLRLDSSAAALKGGKGGPSLVPGDAAKSELYRRVALPKTDDDFMPSEGEPLAKEKLDLLREWINQGAVWPDLPAAQESAAAGVPAAPAGPVLPADFKPDAAELKAIAALAQKGIDVRPIAANLNWREANLRLQGTNVTDATLALLKDVAGMVDLNLATTRVTDAGLANLKGMAHLQRLHLELTGITDAGLSHLKDLKDLTYLNLYGTKVTDAGLEQLTGLKHLRGLYVWQSKVTDAGIKKLKESLPTVEVSNGWDVTALAKKEEKKEEKKAEEKKPEAKKEEKK